MGVDIMTLISNPFCRLLPFKGHCISASSVKRALCLWTNPSKRMGSLKCPASTMKSLLESGCERKRLGSSSIYQLILCKSHIILLKCSFLSIVSRYCYVAVLQINCTYCIHGYLLKQDVKCNTIDVKCLH